MVWLPTKTIQVFRRADQEADGRRLNQPNGTRRTRLGFGVWDQVVNPSRIFRIFPQPFARAFHAKSRPVAAHLNGESLTWLILPAARVSCTDGELDVRLGASIHFVVGAHRFEQDGLLCSMPNKLKHDAQIVSGGAGPRFRQFPL